MGTKNKPGAFDCYAKADPDEPMFVLLARDKHAPALVAAWAFLRACDNEDAQKVEEATACMGAMLEWREAHGRGKGTHRLVSIKTEAYNAKGSTGGTSP